MNVRRIIVVFFFTKTNIDGNQAKLSFKFNQWMLYYIKKILKLMTDKQLSIFEIPYNR